MVDPLYCMQMRSLHAEEKIGLSVSKLKTRSAAFGSFLDCIFLHENGTMPCNGQSIGHNMMCMHLCIESCDESASILSVECSESPFCKTKSFPRYAANKQLESHAHISDCVLVLWGFTLLFTITALTNGKSNG